MYINVWMQIYMIFGIYYYKDIFINQKQKDMQAAQAYVIQSIIVSLKLYRKPM